MEDYKNHTDEMLMRFLREGDESAFNEIYRRYSRRLLHFMFRMLGQDEAKAQDFLQDVFLKLVSHPEKFDLAKNFKTWVFTVAANLCKNHFRAQHKQWVELAAAQEPKSSENTISAFDHQLFKAELSLALNELIPVYREAFILRYHEGLSLNEIAEVTNSPLGTVKSRLHTATRQLSEKLIHHQPQ